MSAMQKVRRISQADAKRMWAEAHAKAPATRPRNNHFLVGPLIKLWDRLPKDKAKAYRFRPAGMAPVLGLYVSPRNIRETLTNLGAGGAGTVQIFPAMVATSATAVGTVNALPADNAAVTVFGAASQGARQNLAYQKDAFTAAFAPLPVLASCEGYTARAGGIALRVMTFGNGQTDVENTRIDVLYGQAATRPDHAVRITQ
jgi:hypothetical protein